MYQAAAVRRKRLDRQKSGGMLNGAQVHACCSCFCVNGFAGPFAVPCCGTNDTYRGTTVIFDVFFSLRRLLICQKSTFPAVELSVKARDYLPGLDLLRIVAFMMIAIFHYFLATNRYWGIHPEFLFSVLSRFEQGVTLFFVLSGFLLTRALLGEIRETGNINVRRYVAARIGRILPAFYFFEAVSLIFILIFQQRVQSLGEMHPIRAWLHEVLLVSNYAPGLNEHIWSLALEAQAYILLPFLLYLGARMHRRAATMIAVLYMIPLIVRVSTGHFGGSLELRGDDFLIGVLAAMIPTFASVPISGVIFALGLAFCVPELVHPFEALRPNLFNLGFAVLVARAAQLQFSRTKVLNALAQITFPAYLWHMIVGAATAGPLVRMAQNGPLKASLLIRTFAVSIFVTLLVASISLFLIEKPLRRLIMRWVSPSQDAEGHSPAVLLENSHVDPGEGELLEESGAVIAAEVMTVTKAKA